MPSTNLRFAPSMTLLGHIISLNHMNEVPLPKTPIQTITRIVSFSLLLLTVITGVRFVFGIIDYTFPDYFTSYYDIFYTTPYSTIEEALPVFLVSFILYIASLLALKNKIISPSGSVYSLGWRRYIYTVFAFLGVYFVITLIGTVSGWIEGGLFSIFISRILVLATVIAFTFLYYLRELKGFWDASPAKHTHFVIAMSVLTASVVFANFAIVGLPSYHRSIGLDISRRSFIENLKQSIECNCHDGILPTTEEFSKIVQLPSSAPSEYLYYKDYVNDLSKSPITYNKIDDTNYLICANFAHDSVVVDEYIERNAVTSFTKIPWNYRKGGCQKFTFDDTTEPLNPFTPREDYEPYIPDEDEGFDI